MNNEYDVLVIGGGAAGFFAAINLAQQNQNLNIAILERGKEVLTKVRISGGGRCNVTHAEFLPKELSTNYPRGEKELLGPFHQFMTGDTMAWFQDRGIELKVEEDGRVFPITDSSETIIDCFLEEAENHQVSVIKKCAVKSFQQENERWKVSTTQGNFSAENLLIATGSNPKIWNELKKLGHRLIPPVPSLFTFNIKDKLISGLAGLSTNVHIKILKENLESTGALLITHWGISGPAVLKLSAWGARNLEKTDYQFEININWLQDKTEEQVLSKLKDLKIQLAKKQVSTQFEFNLPKRLWHQLLEVSKITSTKKWADLNAEELKLLTKNLTEYRIKVNGKSTFKEEFVTAGGIDLKEVNFKTFESKLFSNLYFAGEVLNIDAITGGFNFQNAWTGAYIASEAIAKKNSK